jgi:RND family efflux transporter MFP subunit
LVAVALVLLVVAAGLFFIRGNKAGASPEAKSAVALQFSTADLAHVEHVSLRRSLPVSGALQPVHLAIVRSKVAGEVKRLEVREGQAVAAGQLMAEFEMSDLDAKLADRSGVLEANKAQFALAEKNRELNQKLLKQNFISQNAYDSVNSQYMANQGNLQSAEAQVQLARNAIRDAHVVSPLTGVVAQRQVQAGEKVPMDAPLFTVVDLSQLELQALVPSSDIPQLKPGMNVTLKVDGFGERLFTGKLDRINPATEAGTRSIVVFVTLPNPDRSLKGGMFAAGEIALAASQPVPTLPLTAVRTDGDSKFVWVIEQGKLRRVTVGIGRRDEIAGRAEITTSLSPAMPIVAGKFDNLKEGGLAQVASEKKSSIAAPDAPPSQVSVR